ncbi:hypothetical protein A3F57_03305 [Candidatus Roizmanbacteria bacterium RIFCSPHIGHO2_12_FULL_36_11]|nr:MAG: hypothetical protein A3F57_03305 [Candidatus Roizmanbacteria bacterium RIFCSPHIGHO2_12_FULL_36_11]
MDPVFKQLTHKFVAVLNKKIPVNLLMNALGHMAAGLSASYPNIPEMRFDSYIDKDGGDHKSISDNPFIILVADNSNKIRTLRNILIEKGIHFVDFTSTMTVGTYLEQQQRTKETPEVNLEYYGICLFGEINQVNDLTKKFSLWR